MNNTAQALPLFYRNPVPLAPQRHAAWSLVTTPNYAFAAGTNSLPINAVEFAHAGHNYPIVFAKTRETAVPVVVLGLRQNANLFVSAEGEWQAGTYIPAYARRYPFIFLDNTEASTLTLCVDEGSALVKDSGDNVFFKGDEPTDLTKNALAFCEDYHKHALITQRFAKAVVDADLLVENRADATLAGGEKLTLSGFYRIDEQKLQALPAETVAEWHKEGWLGLAYAHLISLNRWGGLVDAEAAKIAKAA
jgi:hypothetical protein